MPEPYTAATGFLFFKTLSRTVAETQNHTPRVLLKGVVHVPPCVYSASKGKANPPISS